MANPSGYTEVTVLVLAGQGNEPALVFKEALRGSQKCPSKATVFQPYLKRSFDLHSILEILAGKAVRYCNNTR